MEELVKSIDALNGLVFWYGFLILCTLMVMCLILHNKNKN
jgi:hypothetical protein